MIGCSCRNGKTPRYARVTRHSNLCGDRSRVWEKCRDFKRFHFFFFFLFEKLNEFRTDCETINRFFIRRICSRLYFERRYPESLPVPFPVRLFAFFRRGERTRYSTARRRKLSLRGRNLQRIRNVGNAIMYPKNIENLQMVSITYHRSVLHVLHKIKFPPKLFRTSRTINWAFHRVVFGAYIFRYNFLNFLRTLSASRFEIEP